MDRQLYRDTLFPHLASRSYWSFAAISPLSQPARDAIDGWHRALETRGLEAFALAVDAREALRAELAGLLGGQPRDYALTQGTTAGVVALARSMRWRAGEALVVLGGEFPTNVIPWRQAARDFGLEVLTLEAADFMQPAEGLSRLSSILKAKRVALVACSAVEFQTGLALPVREMAALCHEAGASIAIDAIQAAGVVPIDLARSGVDFAVGGGHKWLLGVDGAGWVYVSERGRERLGDAMVGWLSVEGAIDFLFEPGVLGRERVMLGQPRALESGSSSTAAIFATLEGVRLCRQACVEDTFAHVQALHDGVEAALVTMGFSSERASEPAARSGILALRPPAGVSLRDLQAALSRRGVTLTIPDGRLRLAPHFCSRANEGEHILAVMPECLAEVGARA